MDAGNAIANEDHQEDPLNQDQVVPIEPESAEPMEVQVINEVAPTKTKPVFIPGVAIQQICKFATFKELKSFRQVSRQWNCVVSQHPGYNNKSCVKFSKGWNLAAQTLDLSSTLAWKNVRFRYYNFTKQPYFQSYWAQMKSTVEVVKLEYIKILCNDVTNLVNSIPKLKHLSFVGVIFQSILELKQRRLNADNVEERITSIVICDHNQTPFIPAQPIGLRTITSLEIKKQQMPLPHCVLNILIQRCQLEEFKLNGYKLPERIIYHNPIMDDTVNGLVQILRNSQTTLKDFTYVNNGIGCGGLLIQMGNMEQFPNLRLVNLTYLEYQNTTNNDVRGGLQNILRNQGHQALNGTLKVQGQGQEVVIAAAAAVESTLRNVSVTMYLGPNNLPILNLAPVLHDIRSLRKLKIGFSASRNHQRDALDLQNLIVQLPQMTEFELQDIQFVKRHYRQDWVFRDRVRLNFLQNFQEGLRGLAVSCSWPIDGNGIQRMNDFIQNNNTRNLTKLELKNAVSFGDQLLPIVIQHLHVLEELTVQNSYQLTDVGITGLDTESCKNLIRCSSHSLTVNGTMVQNDDRISLCNLRHLKKIDFSGCPRVSDISIRYGITFPGLKWLNLSECANVSDTGLEWLAKTNPSLEVVKLCKINRVSHYGLNRLISINKSIQKIYVSETSVHRKFAASGGPNNPEHPLFKQIVDYSREKEEDPNEAIKYLFH